MRVRSRLLIGYILVLSILLTIGTVAYFIRSQLVYKLEVLSKVAKDIQEVHQLSIFVEQLLMPANDYLISGDPKEKEKYKVLYDRFINKLDELASHQEFDNDLFVSLNQKIKTLDEKAQRIFRIPPRSIASRRTYEVDLMYDMDKIGDETFQLIDMHSELDRNELDMALDSTGNTLKIVNIILSFGILIVIVMTYFLFRFLDSTIREPIELLSKRVHGVSQGRWSEVKIKHGGELGKLAEEFNTMVHRLGNFYDELENKVKHRTEQLDELNQKLKNQAIRDGLTGLYNHRYFYEKIQEEFKFAEKYSKNLTLLMIDLDYFKSYNDTYGHVAGDDLLKKVGTCLQKQSRKSDTVARYGGEEFTIIIPDMTQEQAVDFAERTRKAVYELGLKEEIRRKVTTSVGLAVYPTDAKDYQRLIETADAALYEAKKNGRNRVVLASKTNPD